MKFAAIVAVLIAGAPAVAQALTVDELNRLLLDKGISSVEELLPELPESFRTRNVLVYESKSTQYADPMRPRAILFGDDARLVMAFSSGDAPDSQRVELIQFNDAKRSFEFFETRFVPGRPAVILPRSECVRCHREDPRPNWQAYLHWSGVYGSMDGNLADTPGELEKFEAFFRKAPTDPRYRWLQVESTYERSPLVLTEALGTLNFKRLARLLQADPGYARFKYAYAAAILCGPTLSNALPRELIPPRAKWSSFGLQPKAGELHPFRYLLEIQGIRSADWSMSYQPSLSDRDHSFATPGFTNAEAGGTLVASDLDLGGPARTEIVEEYGVPGVIRIRPRGECSVAAGLADRSREALRGFRPVPRPRVLPPPDRALRALGRCISCHSRSRATSRAEISTEGRELAPEIPFTNELALQPALATNGGRLYRELLARIAPEAPEPIRMPPNEELPATDRETLRSYVDSLMR